MKQIEIDAANWVSALDVYRAIYEAIDAPPDAACNLDALLEYLIWGMGGLELEPPYAISVFGTEFASPDAREELKIIEEYFKAAMDEYPKWRSGRAIDAALSTDLATKH